MRILIIGSAGYVGSQLLQYLSTINGLELDALVHTKTPQVKYANVTYYRMSFEDIDNTFLAKGNYDYIFHLARISVKKYGNLGRKYAEYKGAKANKKLLDNIKKLERSPKLIYLSGSLMYGDHGATAIDEQTPLNPCGFAAYYAQGEQPFVEAVQQKTHDVTMLRAPWILGKGSWFDFLYAQPILTAHKIPVYGNEDRCMSFITVEDCAAVLWHYATHASSGIYNIYTFQSISVQDFTTALVKCRNAAEKQHYTKGDMLDIMDRTTMRSTLCEVVLKTKHQELLDSYTPIHNNFEHYIAYLIKQYDTEADGTVL